MANAPELLVLMGGLMLLAAVPTAWGLRRWTAHQRGLWVGLLVMLGVFILGYAGLLWAMVRTGHNDSVDQVAGFILLSGGLFVWLTLLLASRALAHHIAEGVQRRTEALHDPLTGLPNRLLFNERFQHDLLMARRGNRPVAVMLMDLNRFKEINDTLGHDAGDAVLCAVAGHLRQCVRETDHVTRLGGDEFAVVLNGCGPEEAGALAEKIGQAARTPIRHHDSELSVGLSIGIAVFPEHGEEIESLMRRADASMYQAKRSGQPHLLFSGEQARGETIEMMIVNGLRESIHKGQLTLVFQPKIDLATGRPVGMEALARWSHPELGNVEPALFIAKAEQSGFIRQLTRWVVEEVLRVASHWRTLGLSPQISVNVSPRDLADPEFPEAVAESLRAAGAAADTLVFEFTESALQKAPRLSREVLTKLSALGVRLAMDDFGTGKSSIEHLAQLAIDEVKVDRRFVQGMTLREADSTIVTATVQLARQLGYAVVAEGVEHPEALDQLRALGCARAQGLAIAPPMAAADLLPWFQARLVEPRPVSD